MRENGICTALSAVASRYGRQQQRTTSRAVCREKSRSLFARLTRLLDRSLSDAGTELRQEHADNQQTDDRSHTHLARVVRDRKQQAGSRHHADHEDQDGAKQQETSEEVSQPCARDRAEDDADDADNEDDNRRLPGVPGRQVLQQLLVLPGAVATQTPEDQHREGEQNERDDRQPLESEDGAGEDHSAPDSAVCPRPAGSGVGLDVVRRVVCGGHDDHLLSDKWSCMDCLIPFSSQCASLNAQSRSNGKTIYILSYLC